jgi:chromate reductase, NAD(P)H dehydrogenase (quinone)
MSVPKVLIIPGSLASDAYDVRLAALAAKELTLADAEVTRISLEDYPLPLYEANAAERAGLPANARKLKQLICAHGAVLITSPEYNASLAPLLKNAVDWIADAHEPGEARLAAFRDRAFALGSATIDRSGGLHALLALRQVLAVGCRALVIAEQVTVPHADLAFDEMGQLQDEEAAAQLRSVVRRLIEYARMLRGVERVM